MARQIPVYIFTGFLEGGKTHIIQESMCDERFNTGEKTLIILCEEGIEELDISSFSGQNVYLSVIDSEADVTPQMLDKCRRCFLHRNIRAKKSNFAHHILPRYT